MNAWASSTKTIRKRSDWSHTTNTTDRIRRRRSYVVGKINNRECVVSRTTRDQGGAWYPETIKKYFVRARSHAQSRTDRLSGDSAGVKLRTGGACFRAYGAARIFLQAIMGTLTSSRDRSRDGNVRRGGAYLPPADDVISEVEGTRSGLAARSRQRRDRPKRSKNETLGAR